MVAFLAPLLAALSTPAVAAAGITAAGGLIGAGMTNAQRKRDAKRNSPQSIRDTFEAAGFNPLLGISPAANSTAGYAPQMGSIIANTFASAAGTYQQGQALEIEKARLDMENRRLQDLVNRTTLSADVPGIYGTPSEAEIRTVKGVENVKPKPRPNIWTDGKTRLIGPDNKPVIVPKKWAERLDLKANDAFIFEDFETLFGDEGGQVVGLPTLPGALNVMYPKAVAPSFYRNRDTGPRLVDPTHIDPYIHKPQETYRTYR